MDHPSLRRCRDSEPEHAPTDDTLISCALPNIPGLGKNDVPPRKTDKISLYFDADVSASLQWTARSFVNESGHDPAGNPNTDTRTVTAPQGFGNLSSNQAISFAAPGATVDLRTLLGNSRLEFTTPAGTPPFQARFAPQDDHGLRRSSIASRFSSPRPCSPAAPD